MQEKCVNQPEVGACYTPDLEQIKSSDFFYGQVYLKIALWLIRSALRWLGSEDEILWASVDQEKADPITKS